MQETEVQSLAWDTPLLEEMATRSGVLAWRMPWTEKPGGLQSTGSQKVGHDWAHMKHAQSIVLHFQIAKCCQSAELIFWKTNLHSYCCFSFTEVELIYSVVLVSGVQQSDSVMCVCVCVYTHTLNIYCYSVNCVQLFDTPWTAAEFAFRDYFLSCAYLLSHVWLFATPWTGAHQAPLSMGIFQAKILKWLPCPLPGDLPNPGVEPRSPALQADSLPSEPPGKPNNTGVGSLISYHKILTVVLCAIE